MAVTREEISLDRIVTEEVRARPRRRMVRSLENEGQKQDVRLRRRSDGRYDVIYGYRKIALARGRGWLTIDAVVESERDAAAPTSEQALSLDAQQENLDLLQKAVHAYRLIQEGHYTRAELAVKLGFTRAYVSVMVQVAECPDLVAFINDEGLEFGAAKPLVRLTPAERAELLRELRWHKMKEDRFPTAREIERMVAQRTGEEEEEIELDLERLARQRKALEAAGVKMSFDFRSGKQDRLDVTLTASRRNRERIRRLLAENDGEPAAVASQTERQTVTCGVRAAA